MVVVAGFLLGDGGEGAEEEAADVSQDRGASGRDAALLEEQGEIPELGMDGGGRIYFWNLGNEEGGEVVGVVAEGCGVALAEGGVSGGEGRAALAALGGAVLAACR